MNMCSPPEVYVHALYDFDYELEEGKRVSMREGEEFLLLKKTNEDWWQVIRDGDKRSFYAPANYLEVIVQPGLRRPKKPAPADGGDPGSPRKRAAPVLPSCHDLPSIVADDDKKKVVVVTVGQPLSSRKPSLDSLGGGGKEEEVEGGEQQQRRKTMAPLIVAAAHPAVVKVEHCRPLGRATLKKEPSLPELTKQKREKEMDNRFLTEEQDKNRRNTENRPAAAVVVAGKESSSRQNGKVTFIKPPQTRPPSPIYANFPLVTSPNPPTPRETEFPVRCLDGNWAEFEDPEGRKYYYNLMTKEKSWKPPRRKSDNTKTSSANSSKDSSPQPNTESDVNLHSPTPESPFLPPGWVRDYDPETQEMCYVNDLTKERWFTSTDECGRIYYYEENSAHSFWQLPEVVIAEVFKVFLWRAVEKDRQHSELCKRCQMKDTTPIQLEVGSKKRMTPLLSTSSASSLNDSRRSPGGSPSRTPPKSASPRLRPLSFAERGSKTRSMVLMDSRFVVAENKSDKGAIRSSTLPRSVTSHHVTSVQRTLKQDLLYKTKLCDGGKRTRKNWTTSFVMLTDAALLFYKDARSAQVRQSPHSKPEFFLDLAGATVEWAPEKSSRKNVFQVTTHSGVRILLQDENAQLCKGWLEVIGDVISKLPDEPNSCTICCEKSSPEENKRFRLTRTKSSKRIDTKGSGSSSTEELDAIPSERKTRIRDKLKNFFTRRPTIESLREKGIIKEEPVFGCHLHTLCTREKSPVPKFVQQCIAAIEDRDMKADGLYRASGNLSQVQRIRYQVNQDNLGILRVEEDVHVLTGALKLFFRELKEPLFPFNLFESFLAAVGTVDYLSKLEAFRSLIGALPTSNYNTLKFLLEHLLRVTGLNDYNRMHIQNLAIVFGPTLMWPATESANLALDMMQQNQIVEFLLVEFISVFSR